MITIRDEIRRMITPDVSGMMPVPATEFWMSMSVLITMLTKNQLSTKRPEVTVGRDDIGKRSGDVFKDIIMTLSGNNFVDYTAVHIRAYQFLEWYLEQDPKDYTDENRVWYEASSVIEAYDDYVRETAKNG